MEAPKYRLLDDESILGYGLARSYCWVLLRAEEFDWYSGVRIRKVSLG